MAYAQLLAQNNMTAAQADAELRDEIAERQFRIRHGRRAEGAVGLWRDAGGLSAGGAQLSVFSPSRPAFSVPPVKPTDDQLNAFIKQNGAQLMKPELAGAGCDAVSAPPPSPPTITPSDAEIQKRFNFEKDTLSSPEKRSFVEIPAKDAQTAAAIAAKLKTGADPQAVAKSFGVQAVSYADQPKTGVPDKGVAAAAFSMKAGRDLGYGAG